MTARAATLRRLLEDWEAGRMTPIGINFDPDCLKALNDAGLIAWRIGTGDTGICLSPAGLAAARAEKDEG